RYKIVSTLHSINRYVIPHLSHLKGYQKIRFLLIDYLLVKYSDYLFVYSRRDKRYISLYYKVKPDKIIVVNNGFNEVNIRKEEFSSNLPLKVAFVGNINRKEKAFDLLFNALSLLNLTVKLSVFSHDKQVEIRNYNSINVDLQIHNPLSELEFRRELANNDIFILPSKYESFGISLLEAMSTGIIFIVSSRVGLAERFTPNLKKLIFPKNDPDKLLERINYFLSLTKAKKNFLSSEISCFSKNFSWRRTAGDYLDIYSQLLLDK
ncbi:MAG: glycosyltransferase family 4 protein, partial [Ignavibacteria bacterium]|nr:glycosyltransferase family 4 protein [Ignavibacteria bacterium]